MFDTAALFDFDGVIVDSESQYSRFWSGMEDIYPTGIENFASAIKGTNLKSILAYYDNDEVREDIVSRLHGFEAEMPYPVYPGVRELLVSLRRAGIGCAIVTSSDAYKMSLVYRQLPWLRDDVDFIVDGTMVSHGKPDPEGYLRAAAALGCEPCRCVVFEDSLQGLAAGRAAGAKVVGVATTNRRDAVGELADVVVDSAAEVTLEMFLTLLKL